MDSVDKKILKLLQVDSSVPLSELSKKVGISSTPCWNRIRKMEEEGVIKARIAVIDNTKVNLNLIIYLSVSVSSHTNEWINDFEKMINQYDQILEVYRLTGSSADYMLKIVTSSIEEYDKFQQKLIKDFKFSKMSTSIALKEMKKQYYLPLDHI